MALAPRRNLARRRRAGPRARPLSTPGSRTSTTLDASDLRGIAFSPATAGATPFGTRKHPAVVAGAPLVDGAPFAGLAPTGCGALGHPTITTPPATEGQVSNATPSAENCGLVGTAARATTRSRAAEDGSQLDQERVEFAVARALVDVWRCVRRAGERETSSDVDRCDAVALDDEPPLGVGLLRLDVGCTFLGCPRTCTVHGSDVVAPVV